MTTLYRKYRPTAWSDVAGQNHVKVTLGFEVASGKIAHAYLFTGTRGVGKTTTARILSRAINCTERAKRKSSDADAGEPCGTCEACASILEGRTLDVIEIDAASHRGIDAVRENIIENARFAPAKLAKKVFIIDEVHMLTNEAFNALLKTLEEPPSHVVFILATTELHKVPPTILSRCQRFDFRKIPFTDMVERLQGLCESEKVKVDRRTVEDIARTADGSLRDAESLLGKVLTMSDGKRVTYDEALVVLPRSDAQSVAAFTDALLKRDARTAILTLGDCIEAGGDIDQFATDAIELLRKVMLAKMSGSPDAFSAEMDESSKKQMTGWAAEAAMPDLVFAVETLMEKRRDIKTSHPAQLPLEIAAMKICNKIVFAGTVAPSVAAVTPAAPVARATAAPAPAKPVAKSEPVATAAPVSRETVGASISLDDELTAPASTPAPVVASAPVVEAAAKPANSITQSLNHSTTPSSGDPVTTIDAVKSVWDRFLAKAGEINASLPYVLGVAAPTAINGSVVRLGFDFGFHKDKLNQEKNRRAAEEALSSVLGTAVRIEGVLLEKKQETGEVTISKIPEGNVLQAFGGKVVE